MCEQNKRCGTCAYWLLGCCEAIYTEEGFREKYKKSYVDDAIIGYTVADDHNLTIRLQTSPNFGCTLWVGQE